MAPIRGFFSEPKQRQPNGRVNSCAALVSRSNLFKKCELSKTGGHWDLGRTIELATDCFQGNKHEKKTKFALFKNRWR